MRLLLAALLLPAFARAAPARGSRQGALTEAQRRLSRVVQGIDGERQRARQACDRHEFGHPSCQIGLELDLLDLRARNAQVVASLTGDTPRALEAAEADLLELGWELASYRRLIGSRLDDGDAIDRGEQALFIDAANQAADLRAALAARYRGPDRFAVAIQPVGADGLELKVFVPKSMPPQAVTDALQAGAGRRTLPVKVEGWRDLE